MIIGRLAEWEHRFAGPIWRTAFSALESLSPDATPGLERDLGDGMTLKVMEYATKGAEDPDAILEAHRKHIDIQASLSGSERIDWFPVTSLAAKGPYNDEKDVQYFERPGPAAGSVDVFPGTYAVLFPVDAHMPQLRTTAEDPQVRKVVIKVPVAAVETGTL